MTYAIRQRFDLRGCIAEVFAAIHRFRVFYLFDYSFELLLMREIAHDHFIYINDEGHLTTRDRLVQNLLKKGYVYVTYTTIGDRNDEDRPGVLQLTDRGKEHLFNEDRDE